MVINFDTEAKASTRYNKVALHALHHLYTFQPVRQRQRYHSHKRFRQLVSQHTEFTVSVKLCELV